MFGPNIAIFVAYFLTGRLGLMLPYFEEHVTLMWAPTAIALAGVVFAGPVLAPGIFLASLLINVGVEPDLPGPAAMIAAGNTLAPLAAGMLLMRTREFRPQLDRLRDGLAYLQFGVLGAGSLTATLGALVLCTFGVAPWNSYWTVWFAWFGGELAGLLIAGPLVLTWFSTPDPVESERASVVERSVLAGLTVLFLAVVLQVGEDMVSLPYGFGVLFLWILLRSGLRESTLAIAVVAGALVVGTALGMGPFVGASPRTGMLSLWMFLAAIGGANLVVAGLVADRERALSQQRLLVAELDHRVKNTLASVLGLAERSRSGSADLDEFFDRFAGRVRAMSRTHEGLARAKWEPMELSAIVAATLEPFETDGHNQLIVSGDRATIAAPRVAPFTMILHELATNAAKHGAWSGEGGRVSVEWSRREDGELCLHWRERGGPIVASSLEPGEGLRLVQGLVGYELGGRATPQLYEQGFECTMRFPDL